MGTENLSKVVLNPVQVAEVDFSRVAELAKKFDLNPLQRSNRVNIRLREDDISILESQALESGMPFQTFLADVIHKHAGANQKHR